jgi:hypothetical protein
MRSVLILVGAALIFGGGYVLFEGGSFRSREEVLNVGGLRVSAETRQPILPWMAWFGVAAGGALVVAGLSRKS